MGNITNNPVMAIKPKKAAPAKKPVYGKPEKPHIVTLILEWGFVVFAAGAIIWMIAVNPPQKRLVCDRPGGHSAGLTEFGTCTEE
jgi:hypothetical protein